MKIIFITLLYLMVGCADFSDRVNIVRNEAEQCRGIVNLSIALSGDKERMSFTCQWDNHAAEEDEWQ